jgi:hypothetical protein
LRVVKVRVACDEEYRRRVDWKVDAADRLRRASAAYEREFGIRWVPVSFAEWQSDDAAADIEDLLVQLQRDVGSPAEDVVVALIGQRGREGLPTRYPAGVSNYFDRFAVVSADWPGQPRTYEVHSLAKNLGHLLGAWQSKTPNTVLSNGTDDVEHFDPQARTVISMMRGFDFARGVEGLDEAAAKTIRLAWIDGHADETSEPVAYAYSHLGLMRSRAGEPELAAQAYERSIAIWESCAGPEAPGLVAPLAGLSRTCFERRLRDPVREFELAARARRIAEKTHVDEDPPGDSWVQLGHAFWTNGKDEKSIAAYAAALTLRRRLLGPNDPRTVEARGNVEWFADRGFASAAEALKTVDAVGAPPGAKTK